jgi:putative flippase GtrA
VKDLIASDVNIKNGHFNKENNKGIAKVKEFYKRYPDGIIMEMYSDSMADKPLLDIAKNSFMVKKNKIIDYNTYKPNIFKRFWDFGWGIYHKNEELWNYLIVGGLTTLVSIVFYALFSKAFHIYYIVSNVLSWIVAVIFAYYTNRWFVFHSKNKNKLKEFITFTGSRLLTLLIDTGLMILFVETMKMNDMVAKLIVQVVIIIANYILSKLFVFKNK